MLEYYLSLGKIHPREKNKVKEEFFNNGLSNVKLQFPVL